MSHAATTWQSDSVRKASVLPGPCQPIPITPRLMRLFGEVPLLCAARVGRTAGRIAAVPAVFRNWRRLNERRADLKPDFSGMFQLHITSSEGVATAWVTSSLNGLDRYWKRIRSADAGPQCSRKVLHQRNRK